MILNTLIHPGIANSLIFAIRKKSRDWHPRRLRFAVTGFTWLTLVALTVIAAFYFKHPLFYFWRDIETPLLLLAGAAGACFALRASMRATGRRDRLEAGARLAVCVALLSLSLGQEAWFRWQQFWVLQGGPPTERVGRHFVVGFREFAEVKSLAERGLIGGIYVTRRNLRGESAQSLRRRIDELQEARARAQLPPLFVMADQEGGEVAHLSPLIGAMPALAELLADDPRNLDARARAQGELEGRALASLGINLNLSPVVDLKPGGKEDWPDRHTKISRRAIAADPQVVAQVAAAYGAGLVAAGITPTVKHFPGLGRVRADTHLVEARLAGDLDSQAADWLPFREVTARTGAAMMLAHVRLTDVDPQAPASLSRAVVQGVLRESWNYQGILMTDDLNMGAVYAKGIGCSAAAALNAGVDLVLVTYDPDQYYRALYAAARALRKGGIDARREAESAKRLERFWNEPREYIKETISYRTSPPRPPGNAISLPVT
ncbi:MAG: glycoside hydrolase family 3 protein [Candidatus Accumulibacter sp.]|jgi:beta-N-acetylhexosaminidase|nr:glycoside hydrolase family 3 protein [Accumulibacter sp.]